MNTDEKEVYELLAPTLLRETNTQDLREKVSAVLASYYTPFRSVNITCDATNSSEESMSRGEIHLKIEENSFVFYGCDK